MSFGNERSIITSVYNRIAMDVAAIPIEHVRLDENGRYAETISSGLNNTLSVNANADQTGRAFIQDVVLSMFDEGCVAIVPVETTGDPFLSSSYDIWSLRAAKIVEWFPAHVRVRVYNERTMTKENVILPKSQVAIVENPLYAVMNEPNSTLQRLIRKLNILDAIDEQSGSGKLDLIIQLPYAIKTEARKKQAEERRDNIEMQLSGTKYGIAYADATEHITQLNRPAENNLMAQITYLTSMLYSQLGITESVFDGTADEPTMINYFNRSVEPCLAAIVDASKWKFLTKTARSQGQSIMYFRDPFRLVPVTELADIADSFSRNTILTANEFRSVIGYKPSDDPNADKLENKNMPNSNATGSGSGDQDAVINQLFDGLESDIDNILGPSGASEGDNEDEQS
jgi:predicted transcriptional regulator